MSAKALAAVRKEAAHCRNCPLWKHATQTVFGEGAPQARIMLVGEQPGNQEDLQGKPFVGPAGILLDKALVEAGIGRSEIWLTNSVKHFKWKPKGKFRLHQKPSVGEINACRPWLLRELELVKPQVLVLLGATAARAMLGRTVSVSKSRGILEAAELAARIVLTVHPSFLLRLRGEKDREEAYRHFVTDLRLATAG